MFEIKAFLFTIKYTALFVYYCDKLEAVYYPVLLYLYRRGRALLSTSPLVLPPILRYLHENNNRVISGGCCLPLHDNGRATKAPFVNNFFVLIYNPRRPHGALPRADLHQKTNAPLSKAAAASFSAHK